MTRVLVVGANVEGEQILLSRLQQLAGLPQGSVHTCRDPGQCDVLIVKDTPGLRNAGLRMRQERPDMRLWVEDAAGQLRDGEDLHLPLLDSSAIASVLGRDAAGTAADNVIALPCSAVTRARLEAASGQAQHGDSVQGPAIGEAAQPRVSNAPTAMTCSAVSAHVLTRQLREGIAARTGHAALQTDLGVLAVMDFSTGQAVLPAAVGGGSLAEAAHWLGQQLGVARLQETDANAYQNACAHGQRLPLRALLWQSAVGYPHWDRLDARLDSQSLITLESWPDFRVLARQQDVFRLCSLLVKRPSSLEQCMRLLDLPESTVKTLVRSAFLAGYAQLSSPDGKPPESDVGQVVCGGSSGAATKGSLLARMWRSVRAAGRRS